MKWQIHPDATVEKDPANESVSVSNAGHGIHLAKAAWEALFSEHDDDATTAEEVPVKDFTGENGAENVEANSGVTPTPPIPAHADYAGNAESPAATNES